VNARPVLLCPIDFSEQSRAALRYAMAIGDHFAARVVLLTVEHPLLVDPLHVGQATATDTTSALSDSEEHLRTFVEKMWPPRVPDGSELDFRVAFGQPAREILQAAAATNAELIVMSSRGNSGFRKLFLGSTTERVLRETKVPVLVTPSGSGGALTFEDIAQRAKRVIAPVDFTPASRQQVVIAAGVASALSAPLVLMHVIEPVEAPRRLRGQLPTLGFVQRSEAEDKLAELAALVHGARVENLVVYGEASEEIAKVADVRGATLVVMGLHSSSLLGPRIGSVTYRVLCLSHGLVLAWPPELKPPSQYARRPASDALTA
jgi:nucleotide-binding universal stress UspA family protein